jgi:hypothetical protein
MRGPATRPPFLTRPRHPLFDTPAYSDVRRPFGDKPASRRVTGTPSASREVTRRGALLQSRERSNDPVARDSAAGRLGGLRAKTIIAEATRLLEHPPVYPRGLERRQTIAAEREPTGRAARRGGSSRTTARPVVEKLLLLRWARALTCRAPTLSRGGSQMRGLRRPRLIVVGFTVVALIALPAAASAVGSGNSVAAHQCQNVLSPGGPAVSLGRGHGRPARRFPSRRA